MGLRGRRLLWVLAFALIAAQTLGLMHRVVHGPQMVIGHHDHGDRDRGGLSALFSGHDDDSTCRLFDLLSHDIAPSVPAALLPVVLSSVFLQWAQGEALVRWAALFDARGPPSVR